MDSKLGLGGGTSLIYIIGYYEISKDNKIGGSLNVILLGWEDVNSMYYSDVNVYGIKKIMEELICVI